MRNRSVLVLVCLLVLSLPAMAVGSATGSPGVEGAAPGQHTAVEKSPVSVATFGSSPSVGGETTFPAAESNEETIRESLVLEQRPERPGTFGATATITIPDTVRGLEVSIPDSATIEETAGFEQTGSSTLEWTGETDRPSVTLRVDANRTSGTDVPAGADESGGYEFVETGEWGIVVVPRLSYGWQYERGSDITLERSATVDGPGAVGQSIAVFGPVDEYVSDAGAETHRLVVPEAADMSEEPAAVLETLADAEAALPIGAANDEFFVVAAPTDTVEWRSRGAQYGADDAWVRDDARLDELGNVWLHEYVHSRQSFAGVADGTTEEMRWLVEGQADYYAALVAYDLGLVEYAVFRDFLERGQHSPYDTGVLADPTTWADPETDYARGPLALVAIDREIRTATGNDRTLADAMRALNRADQPITLADFHGAVEDAGGPEARAVAERYVETDAIPDTWHERTHRTIFDAPRTAVEVTASDGPFAVSGPYREGSLETLDDVVPGETIVLPATVENVDDRTGHYSVFAAVDGTVVDEVHGELEPGESASADLSWTPASAGTFDVHVGDHHRTVTVDPPAEATVTSLSVSDRSVGVGESVTATVIVAGDETRPATTELLIATPDGVVDERTIYLGPGETKTVETAITFQQEGRNQIRAGDRTTVVGVGTVAGLAVSGETLITSLSVATILGATVVLVGGVGVLLIRKRGLI